MKKNLLSLIVIFTSILSSTYGQDATKRSPFPSCWEKEKYSYTGAWNKLSFQQIERTSTTNLIKALTILDPSIVIEPNNESGSNPNLLPTISIRGSIGAPLILIDGVEADVRTLYDMNIYDIESVTILKDASSAALYGELAANGVLLIERKRAANAKIRVAYHFVGAFDYADLSSYMYDDFKSNATRTNWVKEPLRDAFSHNHSLNVSGQLSDFSYQLTSRYETNNGVMRGDNRENIGFGFYFAYNHNDKLIASVRGNYGKNNATATPYGLFLNCTKLSPNESPYDESGELKKVLTGNLINPLYEATLSSFDESSTRDCNISTNIRWNPFKNLSINGFGAVNSNTWKWDNYISPLSGLFANFPDVTKHGMSLIERDEQFDYQIKLNASYLFIFSDNKDIRLRLTAGGDVRNNEASPFSMQLFGINDHDIQKPLQIEIGEMNDNLLSLGASANFNFKNRYYIDGSYRFANPTRFLETKENESFWSLAGSWRINNEKWFGGETFDDLSIRGSYGTTGHLVNRFDLRYTSTDPDFSGNPTKIMNIGLSTSLLSRRLSFNANYYTKHTNGILSVTLPSLGIVSTDIKEINRGFEFMLSGTPISTESVLWNLNLNAMVDNKKEKQLNEIPSLNDQPKFLGAFSSYLDYKNFYLNLHLQYSAGRDVYNQSLVDRVENKGETGDPIMGDRWKKQSERSNSQREVSRFIESEKYFTLSYINLGYRLSNDKLKRVGLQGLNFGISINNIVTTTNIKSERGTYYPFARGFSFNLGITI